MSDIAEPTKEQWTRLFAAANAIKRLAPWKVLWDSDLIAIMLPGHEEPVYCSVMGRNGECYAIGVYPGKESLQGYFRLASCEDDPFMTPGFEQDCLMCYFGDREEVSSEDRKVYKELDLKFRGRNAWIYFREMKPGYVPWYLNAEQVDLLSPALEQVVAACESVLAKEIEVDFDGGEMLLRSYSPEKEEWINAAVPAEFLFTISRTMFYDDNSLIARMKTHKQSKRRLEVGFFYMPASIQEKKGDRPYMPRLVLLADKETSFVLDQQMLGMDEGLDDAIMEMIIGYIEKFGRPLGIYVRDDFTGCYISDFCCKLKIEMISDEGLPVLEEVAEMMMRSLLPGFELS
ncbi:MAG: hypothetical protein FWG14_03630 [Peptococcaceae bacterium]|nr:hypothetical protein [Peptococcaceae bacterium]